MKLGIYPFLHDKVISPISTFVNPTIMQRRMTKISAESAAQAEGPQELCVEVQVLRLGI